MNNQLLKIFGLLLLCAMPALAQEHFTEGPIWQVSLIRVKPTQIDAYLTSLQEKSKPFLEEQKRQGLIADYKWFFNQTRHDAKDWDMALAVEYKNFAALDGQTAKQEAIRDKIFGTKQAAQQVGEKREEIREIVEVILMREIMLK